MGPPSKPAEKPKEDGIDVMDVLGGTGIDLREEEQYTFQMYNNSFNSQLSGSQSGTISSGHSFTQFPPGDEASFYGAGPANAAVEKVIRSHKTNIIRKQRTRRGTMLLATLQYPDNGNWTILSCKLVLCTPGCPRYRGIMVST